MWWAGIKSRAAGRAKDLDVYLGTRALAICCGGEKLLFESVQGLNEGVAVLQAWLQSSPSKQALRFWLSGGLCRPFHLPTIPGAKGETELRRIALSMASQHTGLSGECRLWMGRGRTGHSRVCVVVQAETVERLLELGAANGRKVRFIGPWWGEILRHALERSSRPLAVATQDCDALTVLSGAGGDFEVMTTMTPVMDRGSADAALARILMSGAIAAEGLLFARLVSTSPAPREVQFGFALAAVTELAA